MATNNHSVVYLGADHAGFALKEQVAGWLTDHGYEVRDLGASTMVPDDDYPTIADTVARAVVKDQARGLLFCGSAEGVCIVANKTDGVRAAIGFSVDAARATRSDEDANVLCLPGRMMSAEEAMPIVETFLETPFSGSERHARRLKQIKKLEDRN